MGIYHGSIIMPVLYEVHQGEDHSDCVADACYKGFKRVCSGANSTAKNVDGKTAKDVAELNSQTDVVERFQSDKASS